MTSADVQGRAGGADEPHGAVRTHDALETPRLAAALASLCLLRRRRRSRSRRRRRRRRSRIIIHKRQPAPGLGGRDPRRLADRALAQRKGGVEEVVAGVVAGGVDAVGVGRLGRPGPDARGPRLGEEDAAALLLLLAAVVVVVRVGVSPVAAARVVRQPVVAHLPLDDGLADKGGAVDLRADAAGVRHAQHLALVGGGAGAKEARAGGVGGALVARGDVAELALLLPLLLLLLLAVLGTRIRRAHPLLQAALDLGVPPLREVRRVGHLLGLGVRARRRGTAGVPSGRQGDVEQRGHDEAEALDLARVHLDAVLVSLPLLPLPLPPPLQGVELLGDERGVLVGPKVGEGRGPGVEGGLVDALDLGEQGGDGGVDEAPALLARQRGEGPDIPGAESEDPDGVAGQVAGLGPGEEAVDLGLEVGDGVGEGELLEQEVVVVARRPGLLVVGGGTGDLRDGVSVVLVGGHGLGGEADGGDGGVVR
ncbi:hypothetical protein CTA1_6091 [Colletotrichum tanaceti]|uniref:Uncharacterized protein n=1 Tax=Colletotrichum tanaceti TaxID=1306861 RepID=A0A4U6XD19_9PEZI|nr:hypothetical protein CTA1_6091 [Colletotrichum tanaceti]